LELRAKEESPTGRPPIGDFLSFQFSAHARLGEDQPSVSGVAGGNTFRTDLSTPYPWPPHSLPRESMRALRVSTTNCQPGRLLAWAA